MIFKPLEFKKHASKANLFYKLLSFHPSSEDVGRDSKYIKYLDPCLESWIYLPKSLCQLSRNAFEELVETGVDLGVQAKIDFLNFKAKEDIKLWVTAYPQLLRQLPPKFWTDELLLILAKINFSALENFPENSVSEKVWLKAVEYCPLSILSIPQKVITEAIAIKVVSLMPWLYQYLPKSLQKSRVVCLEALQKSSEPFPFMPKEIQQDKELRCLAFKNVAGSFDSMIQNSEIFEMDELKTLVSRKGMLLGSVPVEKRTWEICFLAVQKYSPAIKHVPDGEMKKKLYDYLACKEQALLYDRPDKSVEKIKYLQAHFEFDEKTIDSRLVQSSDFWKWLLSKDPNFKFKHPKKFTEITKVFDIAMVHSDEHNYRNGLKPLFSKMSDPLVSAYSFVYDQKLSYELSKRVLKIDASVYDDLYRIKYLEKTANANPLSYPELNVDFISVLKQSQLKGGRALKNGVHHFKFWKIGENLSDFLREGEVVRYLDKHKESLELRSEIPKCVSVSRVLVTEESLSWVANFKDKPEIMEDESTGNRYFLVYHYQASDDYYVFAHQKSDDPSDPYSKAHEGLKAGIFDVGRLARKGMLFTSVLPSFHNSSKKRKWIVLAHSLGYKQAFPGSMMNWCTEATEFPDYGYSGLRDFGDFALLGVCTDYYPSNNLDRGSLEENREWITTQKGSLYNSLIENCLGVLLLYARLHRNDRNYHYKNRVMIGETQSFIDDILHRLVQGYLGDECEDVCQLMGMTETKYQEWLEIVSQRLIYWTEEQTEDKPCYAQDIVQTGRLDLSLYPNCSYIEYLTDIFTPVSGFSESEEHPNLGAPHVPFPLMNFLEGVTLILLEIEKRTMPER